MLEFGFKLNALVFTYVVNHTYTQILVAENSNCAVLSGTQLLRKSASIRTSIIKQKLNTEHATYDSNIRLLKNTRLEVASDTRRSNFATVRHTSDDDVTI